MIMTLVDDGRIQMGGKKTSLDQPKLLVFNVVTY